MGQVSSMRKIQRQDAVMGVEKGRVDLKSREIGIEGRY